MEGVIRSAAKREVFHFGASSQHVKNQRKSTGNADVEFSSGVISSMHVGERGGWGGGLCLFTA